MYRYIKAFSFSKKEVKKKLNGLSDPILEHLCKVIIYRETYPQYVSGWIDDMAKAIYNASKLGAKNRKIPKKEYQSELFSSFGDNDYNDADCNLSMVEYHQSHKLQNPMDPITITDEMILEMVDKGNEVREEISTWLSNESGPIRLPDIAKKLTSILVP